MTREEMTEVTSDHRSAWPLRPALSLMRSMSLASRLALLGATSVLPLAALLVALQFGAARSVVTHPPLQALRAGN